MTDLSLKLNWNLQWKRRGSAAGRLLLERIIACAPDIVCLTEAYADFLPASGFQIEATSDYGYPIREGRRKVLLWSREPWTDVDCVGDPGSPGGRFIRGRTTTPIGELEVVGVCIPWRAAHVTTGRRDRTLWEDHLSYLRALGGMIPTLRSRFVVVGDFNQTVPRTRAPKAVYQELERAFQPLRFATSARVSPANVQLIDHVAHSHDLKAAAVATLDNLAGSKQLSDHVGSETTLKLSDV